MQRASGRISSERAASQGPTEGALLDRLVADGRIAATEARRAAEVAQTTGSPLPVVLDSLGIMSQAAWATAVAAAHGLEVVNPDSIPNTIPTIPRIATHFLRRHRILPLSVTDKQLHLAIGDPSDVMAVRAIERITRVRALLAVATARDISAALDSDSAATAANSGESAGDAGLIRDIDHLRDLANDAPTIKFVDAMFANAIRREATDIHIEPMRDGVAVRLRIDGLLTKAPAPPLGLHSGVVSRIKILAGLDIAERRLPQDGHLRYRSHGVEVDVRVATAPSIAGETVVMRLLRQGRQATTLEEIKLPEKTAGEFKWAQTLRNGLILVTGPTGSGKTTTLHALISTYNNGERKILTVEDPVEIQVAGAVQVEVSSKLGLGFAAVLRAALRHDPNVIMVGEIRDSETAEIAIQAALTGTIVLSTLHTNDAPSAVARLIDMGVEPFLIASTLRFVAAQRLLRALCPACSIPAPPDGETRMTARLLQHRFPVLAGAPLRDAVGCPQCNGSGYRGRRAIIETLRIDPKVVTSGAEQKPLVTLIEAAIDLAAQGQTTISEVFRIVGRPD